MQSVSVREALATSSSTALSLSAMPGRAVRCKMTFTAVPPMDAYPCTGPATPRMHRLARAPLAHDLHHRLGQPGKLLGPDRERRDEIHDRAERPHEHPLLDEARPQGAEIVDPLKL